MKKKIGMYALPVMFVFVGSIETSRVSSLIGDNIFNPAGETLGKIKDIMIDITEAKIAYVVIDFGGFPGMNQKYLAVPMRTLANC